MWGRWEEPGLAGRVLTQLAFILLRAACQQGLLWEGDPKCRASGCCPCPSQVGLGPTVGAAGAVVGLGVAGRGVRAPSPALEAEIGRDDLAGSMVAEKSLAVCPRTLPSSAAQGSCERVMGLLSWRRARA